MDKKRKREMRRRTGRRWKRRRRRRWTRTVVAVAAAAAAAGREGREVGKEGERAGGRQTGRQARGAFTLTHSHTVAPSVDPHVGHPFPKASQGGGTWLAQALHGSLPPVPSQLLLIFTPLRPNVPLASLSVSRVVTDSVTELACVRPVYSRAVLCVCVYVCVLRRNAKVVLVMVFLSTAQHDIASVLVMVVCAALCLVW
ncbi:hypothetical protein E2C01_084501 [Portunus trituberculatus]|uniref:Uncharacterized protein n=1 Tax=Portunus trituberculatus TaxID=210409 RepID=A0A5B7J9F6_PORTR|nr:hypothetical protein [Portunus trituberculatus]